MRVPDLVDEPEVDATVERIVDGVMRRNNLPSLLRPDSRRLLPVDGNDDPAIVAFHHLLPVELAMGDQPRNEVLKSYLITPERWEVLRKSRAFQKALKDAVDMLQREGMSFRVKARIQSEALLETSWKIIHSASTPSNVKADLIKHTHKVAGYEPKEPGAGLGNNMQININLA